MKSNNGDPSSSSTNLHVCVCRLPAGCCCSCSASCSADRASQVRHIRHAVQLTRLHRPGQQQGWQQQAPGSRCHCCSAPWADLLCCRSCRTRCNSTVAHAQAPQWRLAMLSARHPNPAVAVPYAIWCAHICLPACPACLPALPACPACLPCLPALSGAL